MPELLRVAADAGGIEAVRGLARALGGKRVYVPKTAGDNHPLVLFGGRPAAEAIMKAIGGEHVEFPKGEAAIRFTIAVAMVEQDKSDNEIAQGAGITYRHARRLRALIKLGGTVRSGKRRGRKIDPRQIDIEELLTR